MRTTGPEFEWERGRLAQISACVDRERDRIARRLRDGVMAADDLSRDSLAELLARRSRALLASARKPYFAKIDFEPDEGNPDRAVADPEPVGSGADRRLLAVRPGDGLYIGRTTVVDEAASAVVVDWRAPIASLYYEARLGRAAYLCPDGRISGLLRCKRQIFIADGALQGYEDIDVLSDDELLTPFLSLDSDARLREIISTIQAEQNLVIRAPAEEPLLVQGAAGSGKTTVALHRVAYLAYTYGARCPPGSFVILGPSALFLGYISGVLPDLGVEDAWQRTYEQFVREMIHVPLKVEDPAVRLERVLLGLESEDIPRYKSSLAFRAALDRYVETLASRALPEGPFLVGGFPVCSEDELRDLFHIEWGTRPLSERRTLLKNRLLYLCQAKGGRVVAAVDADRRRKLSALTEKGLPPHEFRTARAEIVEEHEAAVSDLTRGGHAAVDDYIGRIAVPSAPAAYAALLSNQETLRACCGEAAAFLPAAETCGKKTIVWEYEDLAPLLYLNLKLQGPIRRGKRTGSRRVPVFHLVVDEAQDYSPFQAAVVLEALGYPSCTLLGDLAQGIYDYRGLASWEDLREAMDGHRARGADMVFQFREMTKSYRTTVEILEAALSVLDRWDRPAGLSRPEPVIRHGPPVEYKHTISPIERAAEASESVLAMLAEGYKNVAVICRTARTCERLSGQLRKRLPGLHRVTVRDQNYPGGTVLMPAVLAKGLEFDGVVVADAPDYGNSPRDIKLLYVAMTRAMHKLVVLT